MLNLKEEMDNMKFKVKISNEKGKGHIFQDFSMAAIFGVSRVRENNELTATISCKKITNYRKMLVITKENYRYHEIRAGAIGVVNGAASVDFFRLMMGDPPSEPAVQECDATMLYRSPAAGNQKINP